MTDRTEASSAWPRALALGLLPTRGGRLALLALLALPVVLIDGIRTVDADLPGFLAGIARGAMPVPAERGFLLEGVLTDGIGAGFARAGLPPEVLAPAWWGLGLLLLAAMLALSLRRGELAFRDLLLIWAFSHLVDTLALWVGKFDPWLMAFLVLSAWRRPGPAVAGAVLAALCHPILAVLSTAGVAAVDLALERRFRALQAGAVLLAAAGDLALAHRILPGLVDRAGYAENLAAGLLHDAALLALPTLVSAALVPFVLVRCFAGPFRYGERLGAATLAVWAAAVLFVGCVATLDHTRVLCLLTLAPALAFLRHQKGGIAPERWDWALFALLMLCRLALGQIDGNGAIASTPYPLAPWVGP